MTITDIKEAVTQFAPLYPVLSVELFGSYANNEDTENSDVDLLVYFDEKIASLFDLSGFKLDVEGKLQKKIDVVAGPLKDNTFLTINKKVKIYGA